MWKNVYAFSSDFSFIIKYFLFIIIKVSGGRVRGRPRLGWMDGVKVVRLRNNARKTEKHGEPWYICN